MTIEQPIAHVNSSKFSATPPNQRFLVTFLHEYIAKVKGVVFKKCLGAPTPSPFPCSSSILLGKCTIHPRPYLNHMNSNRRESKRDCIVSLIQQSVREEKVYYRGFLLKHTQCNTTTEKLRE